MSPSAKAMELSVTELSQAAQPKLDDTARPECPGVSTSPPQTSDQPRHTDENWQEHMTERCPVWETVICFPTIFWQTAKKD